MKTVFALSATLIAGFFLTLGTAYATAVDRGKPMSESRSVGSDNAHARQVQSAQRQMRRMIGYPEFLSGNQENVQATVQIRLGSNGRVEHTEVITDHPNLRSYIESRIQDADLSRYPVLLDRTCRFVVEFRYAQ